MCCRSDTTALLVAVLMNSFSVAELLLKVRIFITLAVQLFHLCPVSLPSMTPPQHGADVNARGKCAIRILDRRHLAHL
jgi:hypothetical protein